MHFAILAFHVGALQDSLLEAFLHICPVLFVGGVVGVQVLSRDGVVLTDAVRVNSTMISRIGHTPLNVNHIAGVVSCNCIESPGFGGVIPVDLDNVAGIDSIEALSMTQNSPYHVSIIFLATRTNVANTLARFSKGAISGVWPKKKCEIIFNT